MSYHNEIMNIEVKNPQHENMTDRERIAYKLGHRDARHAAAEVANSADTRIEELENAMREALEELEWFERNQMGGIRLAVAERFRELLGISKLYMIFNTSTKESFYWGENQGWVDEDSATIYSEEDYNSLNLPMDGEWRRIQ